MAISASLAWQQTLADLMITPLDRRPSDTEGDFLLARIAAMFVISAVKSRPQNILHAAADRRARMAEGLRCSHKALSSPVDSSECNEINPAFVPLECFQIP